MHEEKVGLWLLSTIEARTGHRHGLAGFYRAQKCFHFRTWLPSSGVSRTGRSLRTANCSQPLASWQNEKRAGQRGGVWPSIPGINPVYPYPVCPAQIRRQSSQTWTGKTGAIGNVGWRKEMDCAPLDLQ